MLLINIHHYIMGLAGAPRGEGVGPGGGGTRGEDPGPGGGSGFLSGDQGRRRRRAASGRSQRAQRVGLGEQGSPAAKFGEEEGSE